VDPEQDALGQRQWSRKPTYQAVALQAGSLLRPLRFNQPAQRMGERARSAALSHKERGGEGVRRR
jgi:hypothetical protein